MEMHRLKVIYVWVIEKNEEWLYDKLNVTIVYIF